MGKKILVRQHDATDCAAACLATVSLYYKKEVTITKLRDILGTDIKGTNLNGLEKGAKQLGFTTKAIRVDKEGFKSKFTLPCIAHMITKEGLAHFVVIYKIKNEKVIVLDPDKGEQNLSIDEFFKYFDGVLLLLVPNEEFKVERIKGNSLLDKFVKLLLPQKKLFVYSMIASVILMILGIGSSFFNKFLMDEILPYNLKNQLNIVIVGFLLVGVTQIILEAIRGHMLLYLSQKIDIPLLLGYFKHIYKLPMKFFSTRTVGDILTRFSDAFTIKEILTSVSLSLIMDIFLTVVSATILYIMNQKLFIVIAILTLINTLLIYIFKEPYKKVNVKQMEAGARLNSEIIESLKGIETIKVMAAEEKKVESLEDEYIENLKISFDEGVLSNIQGSISNGVSTIGNLILMYIGALQVMNSDITLGSLMAFASLSGYFMEPIGRIIELQLSIQEASISLKRLSEIYEVEEEQKSDLKKVKIREINEDVTFENVSFRYGSRRLSLKNVSMKIPKGKKVAIVGSSGSGKTTISKLILRYYNPEEGRIKIGDNELDELDIYSLRKSIAYVPQNVELFSGTIRENLLIGTVATEQQMRECLEISGCMEFINKLPGRYDAFLDEAGGGLSGGEKQRLALARALIKRTEFIILDEATSNLDFFSEFKIYDAIFNRMKNKTMLIIAHRLSTIKNCDMIYVLHNGKVVEVGNHEELIEKKKYYYRLYNSQSNEFEVRDKCDKEIEEKIEEGDDEIYEYS